MSAVGLVVLDEGILFAGDGVASDEKGRVSYYCSKLHHFPELGAVISGTGVAGLVHLLMWFMPSNVTSFDGLINGLGNHMRSVFSNAVDRGWIQGEDRQSNIVVAGYSVSRGRFEAWRVTTYEKKSTSADGTVRTLSAWQPEQIPAGSLWCSSFVDRDSLERFGLLSAGPADDIERLSRLICASRSQSGPQPDDKFHNVGGYIQIAALTADHYQSWISHRWPEDVLGQPIDPSRGQPLPDHLMPLG